MRAAKIVRRYAFHILTIGVLASFSVTLVMVLRFYATRGELQTIGLALLTPLALLLGLANLMYNRARAIESKSNRFRSLYAAERLVFSCGAYALALVIGFSTTVFLTSSHSSLLEISSQKLVIGETTLSFPAPHPSSEIRRKNIILAIYSPSLILFGLAGGELLFALFAIRPPTISRKFFRVARAVSRLRKDK